MKTSKILSAAATAYVCVGIFTMLFIDNHPSIGWFTLLCFIGAWGFQESARLAGIKELFDEDGTGND